MELWDAYTGDGRQAGCDLVRGEPIPKGLYHLVAEVLVRHADGTYLVMQRDQNKIGYPGYWEAGASGSVLKGETPLAGALRELGEETGLYGGDLSLIYLQRDAQRDTFFYGYFYSTDCAKDAIRLQDGETIAYRWLDQAAFLAFMDSDAFVPRQRSRWQRFLDQVML